MEIKVKGILSYPHLFQPRAVQQGDEPKYSANVLIRKDDPQVEQVNAIIEQEKVNGFPSGFPANGKCCWKDGAVAHPDNPAMHNYMILSGNAKADSKPHVVGADLEPVMDPGQAYAGAVVWASVNTFVYNQAVNKGIGGGLNGVMFTGEEGELGRLDGKPSAEAMFGNVAGGAAPAATPQPAAAPAHVPPAAAPAPAPAAPPAPAPAPAPASAEPQYQMTEKANGLTRDQYLATPGWTDELLIQEGLMLPPGGVAPSFT